MNEKQSVDIFILTYNRLEYLKTSIEMLYLSTSYSFHLYLIDNGSIDGSRDFIVKLEKEGLIYKHLFTEQNIPLASAYTACFNKFKDELGEFIITAPNDIIPPIRFESPDWLSIFVAKMQDENIGCVNFIASRQAFNSFNMKVRPKLEARIREEGGERLELFNRLERIIYDR